MKLYDIKQVLKNAKPTDVLIARTPDGDRRITGVWITEPHKIIFEVAKEETT